MPSRKPAGIAAGVLLAFAAMCLAVPYQQAPQPAAAPTPAAATYVGSETCQACHEDIFEAHQKSPHFAVESDKRRGWEGKACESCHGPGSKHAESVDPVDIRNPAKLAPAERDKTCLQCHLNQPAHAGRIQSSHAKNQVGCTVCHPIHQKGSTGLVSRKRLEVNAQCATCHVNAASQFQRAFRHRLPEGVMSCVDCHNPHGAIRPETMMRVAAAGEPGCFRCHTDKRGPFTFEHAPVRLEGCGSCHEAHGSTNPRMLVRAEVRYVCLECHANLPQPPQTAATAIGVVPPAFHDLRSPRYRNCTICHQKIHGSHVDRNLLR